MALTDVLEQIWEAIGRNTDQIGDVGRRVFQLRREVAPLLKRRKTLVAFADNPIGFIWRRLIPVLLGAFFELVFGVTGAVAGALNALETSLTLAAEPLLRPLGALIGFLSVVGRNAGGLIADLTAPLGPLQPFVVTVFVLGLAYVAFIVTIRLGRALLDSVPALSGLETFLFG